MTRRKRRQNMLPTFDSSGAGTNNQLSEEIGEEVATLEGTPSEVRASEEKTTFEVAPEEKVLPEEVPTPEEREEAVAFEEELASEEADFEEDVEGARLQALFASEALPTSEALSASEAAPEEVIVLPTVPVDAVIPMGGDLTVATVVPSPEDQLLAIEIGFLQEALLVAQRERDEAIALAQTARQAADEISAKADRQHDEITELVQQLTRLRAHFDTKDYLLRAQQDAVAKLDFEMVSLQNKHSLQIAEMLSQHDQQLLQAATIADQRVAAVSLELATLNLWQVERGSTKRAIVVGRDAQDALRRALAAQPEETLGKITGVRAMNERVIF